MKNIVRPVALGLSFLCVLACGKKGAIQPPLVLVPQKIEALKAVQRADAVVLEWTNPVSYIDGSPLEAVSEVEIWIYEASGDSKVDVQALTAEAFESKARRLALLTQEGTSVPTKAKPKKKTSPAAKVLRYSYSLSEKELKGTTLIFGLRVKEEAKGRLSQFSNLAAVTPQPLPVPPSNVRADVFEDRIAVRWQAPSRNFDHSAPARIKGYNIYRSEGQAGFERRNTALIMDILFEDKDFLFGRTYRYLVRAAASDATPPLESGDSAAFEVRPKDVFPPSAPSGLAAMKGLNLITLIWEANKEKDLSGYKIWRKLEGENAFVLLTAQLILQETYTDTAVEKNKRYEYAITAVDSSGNESPRSASVSEIIKDLNP